MPRKNVQDELRAIDHAAISAALKIAQLRGSQVAVENNQRRFVKLRLNLHFLNFAAANDGGGINLIAHLKDTSGNVRARTACHLRELCQGRSLRLSTSDTP